MTNPITIEKQLLGGYWVHYDCSQCSGRLKSPVKDGGKLDTCPLCGAEFRVPVPGVSNLEQYRREKEEEQAKLERCRREQEAKLRAEKTRRMLGNVIGLPKYLAAQLRKVFMQLPVLTTNLTRIIVVGLSCITILLIAIFVWPTPYRIEKVSVPVQVRSFENSTWNRKYVTRQEVYRINRFTGKSVKIIGE